VSQPHHKTCDVVLEAVRAPKRRVLCFAGVGALVLHIGGAAVALALAAHADVAKPHRVKAMVVVDHVVDLTPPPAPKVEEPPPAPPPEAPPPPPPPVKPKIKAAKEAPPAPPPEAPPVPENAPEPEKPPSEPPPAAQAAQVVAADHGAEDAFKVVTGSGSSFAGGTTTASGTGTQANHTGQIGTGNGNGYSKARAPQVASRNWPCGWPSEAEDLDIEEMYVTVKAVVKANGELGDVKVLQDPGYGFAKRAVWCARTKVRFDPALDANGSPIEGETPPMRVKFERSDDF
jgi:protein TonB